MWSTSCCSPDCTLLLFTILWVCLARGRGSCLCVGLAEVAGSLHRVAALFYGQPDLPVFGNGGLEALGPGVVAVVVLFQERDAGVPQGADHYQHLEHMWVLIRRGTCGYRRADPHGGPVDRPGGMWLTHGHRAGTDRPHRVRPPPYHTILRLGTGIWFGVRMVGRPKSPRGCSLSVSHARADQLHTRHSHHTAHSSR